MKHRSYLFIAALAAVCMFGSCKKGSSSSDPNPNVTSSMKFTVNGTAVSYNSCEEAIIEVNGASQTTFLGNFGHDANFEVDIMHDPTTLKAGQTYQMASEFGQPDGAMLFYSPNANDDFTTQPANPQGSVTITSVTSTTISGTFSGKLFATGDFSGTTVLYTITDGSFTAKINKK